MSPDEIEWRHRTGDDGLVHVSWSTDGGATWDRATVKTTTTRGKTGDGQTNRKLAITELRLPNPTTTSLREFRLGALERYLNQQLAPAVGNVTVQGVTARARASARGGRVFLERPDTPRLGDEFYAYFAERYREAAARGLPPRPTLAADAGVSRAAIARWAREARSRGYLTSGGMGKVSD